MTYHSGIKGVDVGWMETVVPGIEETSMQAFPGVPRALVEPVTEGKLTYRRADRWGRGSYSVVQSGKCIGIVWSAWGSWFANCACDEICMCHLDEFQTRREAALSLVTESEPSDD